MTHLSTGKHAFITWFVVMAGCVWFLTVLLRAAERYNEWKWLLQ